MEENEEEKEEEPEGGEGPEETLEPLVPEEKPDTPDVATLWCNCAEREGKDREVCEGIWDGFKSGDVGQEETESLLREQFGEDLVEKISEEIKSILGPPEENLAEGDEDET